MGGCVGVCVGGLVFVWVFMKHVCVIYHNHWLVLPPASSKKTNVFALPPDLEQ